MMILLRKKTGAGKLLEEDKGIQSKYLVKKLDLRFRRKR